MPSKDFNIPSQDITDGRFVRVTNSQIEEWLEALPRGNADQCAEEIKTWLAELNRSTLQKANRYALMELIRREAFPICEALASKYASDALPLRERAQNRAIMVLEVYSALATGFRVAVAEYLDELQKGNTKNVSLGLQLSTQRALLCLGRTLVETYRIYLPDPTLLWRDLHMLYHNAEKLKLHTLPVEAVGKEAESALSIKQAYLRIVLLSLSNPYHLMQGEATQMYERVGRWVNFVKLIPVSDNTQVTNHYVVDLISEAPPRYVPSNMKALRLQEGRMLELEDLIKALGDQIDRSAEDEAGPIKAATFLQRMQRDMYIRLRNALSVRRERKDQRNDAPAKLIVVEGLSACHYYMNGKKPFTPEKAEKEWQDKLSGKPKSKGPLGFDIDDLQILDLDTPDRSNIGTSATRTSEFKAVDKELDDIWKKANTVTTTESFDLTDKLKQDSAYKAAPWDRRDESAGGMALFCAQKSDMKARVGEIVGYHEDGGNDLSKWQIGSIRWLRSRPNGGMELGIQNICDSGTPVGTKAIKGAGKGSEYYRALLVPRVNPIIQPATLITPASVYDVGSVLILNMGELIIYVQLTELIEATRLYAHFKFVPIEAPNQNMV